MTTMIDDGDDDDDDVDEAAAAAADDDDDDDDADDECDEKVFDHRITERDNGFWKFLNWSRSPRYMDMNCNNKNNNSK